MKSLLSRILALFRCKTWCGRCRFGCVIEMRRKA